MGPTLDIDDWKQHTVLDPEQVDKHPEFFCWFWDVVEKMDAASQAKLLSFTCGSGRLPPAGFRGLKPHFNVQVKANEAVDHLPTAHTCSNQLCLPLYASQEQLEE